MTPSPATIRAAVSLLAARGYSRDHATSLVYHRAQPRFDIDTKPHAHALAHRIANARNLGTVATRRRVPRQQYPHALEAAYAQRLVEQIRRARTAYDRLLVELPRLLARVQANLATATMDSAGRATRMDAIATFAQLEAASSAWQRAELDRLPERATGEVTFAAMPVDGGDQWTPVGRDKVAGLDIVIENAAGSKRTWIDADGSKGSTLMRYAYGFIADAMGADGDEVDVYIGPDAAPDWVYVVHQRKKSDDFASYDEDKVMLGWSSADDAKAAYLDQYTDPRFFGGMSTFAIDVFRAALASRAAANDGGIIAHRADAGELAFAKSLIEEAAKKMRHATSMENSEKLARYFARETSQAQRRELSRQLTGALGVEVIPDERHIPEMLEYFTHENATMIGSIPEDLHKEVASLTARAFTKRMNPDTFAQLLQDRFDIAEGRARFIARDQLGKLWGQLNAVRQRGLGIDEFIWRTKRDDKVRKTHRALEGVTISFTDLPPFGLPGEDYGCRCTGDPVVDGILDRAAELQAHRQPVQIQRL